MYICRCRASFYYVSLLCSILEYYEQITLRVAEEGILSDPLLVETHGLAFLGETVRPVLHYIVATYSC